MTRGLIAIAAGIAVLAGLGTGIGEGLVAAHAVSAIGRNLWIIHKNVPYSDPEAGLSAGNIQGFQSGAHPTIREIGASIKVQF